MRKVDFFEIKKDLNLEYTNKQVISCASINVKKENIYQEMIKRENQANEKGIFKNCENEGIYLDINYNSSKFGLQPCIASNDKTFRLPKFELSHEIQFPCTTYQVKPNSRLYEDIYSIIYSKYSGIGNNNNEVCQKIKISEASPIFEFSELEEKSYSLYWVGDNLFSSSSLVLGEITGILYSNTSFNGNNLFSFELPSIANEKMNITLDISKYCNEFAFLKHCRLPYPFDNEFIKPNTQLKWLYIDQWPHLVVLTIPGVEIKQGDELVVDFGEKYHEKYLSNYRNQFRKLLNLKINDEKIIFLCHVCSLEILSDSLGIKKCVFCHKYLHEKCGYQFTNKENSVCCLACLESSFNIIFGIYKGKDEYFLYKNVSNFELNEELIKNTLKMLDTEYKVCNECSKISSKRNTKIEKETSST